MRTWKSSLFLSLLALAASAPARAQFGLGATYGSVNNVSNSFTFEGFKPSEWTVFVDYHMEKSTLLRLTYGSMWTLQANAGIPVTVPGGAGGGPAAPVTTTVPGLKERINYGTADVSYQIFEGFYTGGMFAGIGVYGFNPQDMPPEFAAYQDPHETVFGFNAGLDGEFRFAKNFSGVLRFTYHNIMATQRREFVVASAGFVARY